MYTLCWHNLRVLPARC